MSEEETPDPEENPEWENGYHQGHEDGFMEGIEQVVEDLVRGIAQLSVNVRADKDMTPEQREMLEAAFDKLAASVEDGSLLALGNLDDDESAVHGPN